MIDRVLIEVFTTSHLTGINEAQGALAGLANPLMVATVGMGALVFVGKQMIDISQEHAHVEKELANAIQNRGLNAAEVTRIMTDFNFVHRDAISNQNEVAAGFSALIREGVPLKEVLKDMNTALNIQAIEGGTLTEAVDKLQSAEVGRVRGLKNLVGLTLEAIPAHATLAEKMAIAARNADIVAAAYKGGTDALTPLQVATDHLSVTWEKLAEKDGPELVKSLTALVTFLDTQLIPTLDRVGGRMNTLNNTFATDLQHMVSNPNWYNLNALINDLAGGSGKPGSGPKLGGLTRQEQWNLDHTVIDEFANRIARRGSYTDMGS